MKAIVLSAAILAGAATAAPVTVGFAESELPKWQAAGVYHISRYGGYIPAGSSVTIGVSSVQNYFINWMPWSVGSLVDVVYRTEEGNSDAHLEITASYWQKDLADTTFTAAPTNGADWHRFIQSDPWQYFDSIIFTARNGAVFLGPLTFEIPEPATLALFGAGLVAMFGLRRRQRI